MQALGHVPPRDVQPPRDLRVRTVLNVPQLHDLAERGRQLVDRRRYAPARPRTHATAPRSKARKRTPMAGSAGTGTPGFTATRALPGVIGTSSTGRTPALRGGRRSENATGKSCSDHSRTGGIGTAPRGSTDPSDAQADRPSPREQPRAEPVIVRHHGRVDAVEGHDGPERQSRVVAGDDARAPPRQPGRRGRNPGGPPGRVPRTTARSGSSSPRPHWRRGRGGSSAHP